METYSDSTSIYPEICATSNMATTHMDYLARKMLPEDFRQGNDVEAFIEECERYFQYVKLPEARQETTVELMLEKNVRGLYRKVEPTIKGYKDRLRTAFQNKTSMIEDVRNAFEFRQTDEEPESYFLQIDKLVSKIMAHNWTKENLTEHLLVHCSNERSLKREICLNGITGIEGIKGKIEKLHESKITEEVNAMRERRPERTMQRSFKDVVVARRPGAQGQGIYGQEKRSLEC